jgi:hypothetical protein
MADHRPGNRADAGSHLGMSIRIACRAGAQNENYGRYQEETGEAHGKLLSIVDFLRQSWIGRRDGMAVDRTRQAFRVENWGQSQPFFVMLK